MRECKVRIKIPKEEECLELRKRLQKARYQVLEDGENWLGIAQAIEAVGKAIAKKDKYRSGLGSLKEELRKFVKKRHPTTDQRKKEAERGPLESTFENLLEEVIEARNDEAHTGAAARAAARIATVVGIYLEDTLMAASGAEKDGVKAYIQEQVVRAYTWQRLGECRRRMLTHSFSYLPVQIKNEIKNEWKMLSDADLAEYLVVKGSDARKETVEEAIKNGLNLEDAVEVKSIYCKEKALKKMKGKAAVVIKNKELLGIITPFDLL